MIMVKGYFYFTSDCLTGMNNCNCNCNSGKSNSSVVLIPISDMDKPTTTKTKHTDEEEEQQQPTTIIEVIDFSELPTSANQPTRWDELATTKPGPTAGNATDKENIDEKEIHKAGILIDTSNSANLFENVFFIYIHCLWGLLCIYK
jgi:hypothetical protein